MAYDRAAAATALGDFETTEAEQALLHVANFDPNGAVRRTAILGFRRGRRSIAEDSVPCPSSAPVIPGHARRDLHADEDKRHRAAWDAGMEDETPVRRAPAPEQPPTPSQLWLRDVVAGIARSVQYACSPAAEFRAAQPEAGEDEVIAFEATLTQGGNASAWALLPDAVRATYTERVCVFCGFD